MLKGHEFWQWMQTKGTLRERIVSSLLNKVIALAIGGGGLFLLVRFTNWAIRRSVTIDKQGSIVIEPWIGYVLTSAFVLAVVAIFCNVLYFRFLNESSGNRGTLGDLLIGNVAKILNVTPSIPIVYELDQRTYRIDNGGRDKIKTSLTIAKTDKPVTLIPIKHYSTEAYKSPFLLNPQVMPLIFRPGIWKGKSNG
jgi:hypothetical protein